MVGAPLERALALGRRRLRADEGEADEGHGGRGEPAAEGLQVDGEEEEVREEEHAHVRRVGEGLRRVVKPLHRIHGAREGGEGAVDAVVLHRGQRGVLRARGGHLEGRHAHHLEAVERLLRGGQQRVRVRDGEHAGELAGSPGLGSEEILHGDREGQVPAQKFVADF